MNASRQKVIGVLRRNCDFSHTHPLQTLCIRGLGEDRIDLCELCYYFHIFLLLKQVVESGVLVTMADLDFDNAGTAPQWFVNHVSTSSQWATEIVAPGTLHLLRKASDLSADGRHRPTVYVLKPGTYRIDSSITILRHAPCLIKAEDPDSTIFLSGKSDTAHSALLVIEGTADVVIQGVLFSNLSAPQNFSSCVLVSSGANVAFSDCRFAADSSASARRSSSSCGFESGTGCGTVSAEERVGLHIRCCASAHLTQCEFVSGDVAMLIRLRSQNSEENAASRAVAATKRGKTTKKSAHKQQKSTGVAAPQGIITAPSTCCVTVEDCGFASRLQHDASSSLDTQSAKETRKDDDDGSLLRHMLLASSLVRGIVCESSSGGGGAESKPCELLVDHSTFENLDGPVMETSPLTQSSTHISIKSSTIVDCGERNNASSSSGTETDAGGEADWVPPQPALILRGRAALLMADCSVDNSGVLIFCHETSVEIRECVFKALLERVVKSFPHGSHWYAPATSSRLEAATSSSSAGDDGIVPYKRQLIAQDRASVSIQRCEWTLSASASAAPLEESALGTEAATAHGVRFTFLTLLSTGNVTVDGSLFQLLLSSLGAAWHRRHSFGATLSRNTDDRVAAQLAGSKPPSATLACIVVDGSSAPQVSGNQFHCDLLSRAPQPVLDNSGNSERPPRSTDASSSGEQRFVSMPDDVAVRGVLLGLWHDAKFNGNSFSGALTTEESYSGLEDCADATILAQPFVEKSDGNEWQPSVPNTETAVLPSPAAPPQKKKGAQESNAQRHSAPEVAAEAASAASPSAHAQESEDARIAKLEAHIRMLEEKLREKEHKQQQPRRPSRPSTAHASRRAPTQVLPAPAADVNSVKPRRPTARPKSAGYQRSQTSEAPRQRHTGAQDLSPSSSPRHEDDEEMVAIGKHQWCRSKMKLFMQGRCPLSEVRRPADESADPGSKGTRSPVRHHTPNPAHIYDNWEREMREKRANDEMLHKKQMEEEASRRHRLTKEEMAAHVARIHTESIEHLQEVRRKWIEEERNRYTPRGRPQTLREADIMLEAYGDFQERYEKDIKDRALRREKLLQKYVAPIPHTTRSRSEIEAYASSMHKSHHDEALRSKAAAETGVEIRVAPPRSAYPKKSAPRKVLKDDDMAVYCASLYVSHKIESLAEKAAAIAGDDAIARVGLRSASRGAR